MATALGIAQVHIDGIDVETIPLSWQWNLPATIYSRVSVTWNGNTALVIPTGTTLIIIEPDPATVAQLTLKGNNADAGNGISSTKPLILTYASGSVILNASAPATATITYL